MLPDREAVHLQLERRTRQLRAVGEISAALASAWELEPTLEAITRITSEVMTVASCSIYLEDRNTGRLVLKATTGLAPEAIGIAALDHGEGLTGWSVTHGRPVTARDAREDPRFKPLPETREDVLHSLLAVPLTVQGRTIGAMNVQTIEPHDFGADDVELLSLIANLAAGALEKAALYENMRRQIRELEGLIEVSRTITSPLFLDEMLGVVVEMAARVMSAHAVALHLLDPRSRRLELRATHNTSALGRVARSFAIGEGLVGRVAAGSTPITLSDARHDPRFHNRALAEREGLVSLLSVPLVVREQTVGVMTCYTRTPHEFGPQEIDLFSMLANQTALAIENARLLINSAVVREMHHRVKNNLQTVAMLLRLERGASADAQTCAILERAMGRVLSIAAVHETLSEQGLEMVAVKQVLERVARHVAELAADKEIRVDVGGEVPALPSRAATSLALIATELMQNAVTHGFRDRTGGQVSVTITADPREYVLRVADNGVGAGASATHAARARSGGSTSSSTRLGLEIVRTLVKHDLAGEFEMVHSDAGTCATIRFPTTTTRER